MLNLSKAILQGAVKLKEGKTRWTNEEAGRQQTGMGGPGVRQVPEGNGEQGKKPRENWL